MTSRRQFLCGLSTLPLFTPAALALSQRPPTEPSQARTVLVLGDSITWAGAWVVSVEAWFRMTHPKASTEFINLGLPSETVSGLSEPGHAGGSFPRPDLHERLQRALDKIHPDLVVACYGMNDGIYFPWSEDRGKRHFDGIQRLRDAVAAAGASITHLTPPVFDPVPLAGRTLPAGRDQYPSPYEGYDEVLTRYSEWLLSRKKDGWDVVDVHGPMTRFIADARRSDPKFTLAGDGVHPGPVGHWLIARELLRRWKAPAKLVAADSPDALAAMHPRGRQIVERVAQRQNLLRDAWLSEVGHQRPGMGKGRPLTEARTEAARALEEIRRLLS
jgi:lysophospholipase L1-like esterase